MELINPIEVMEDFRKCYIDTDPGENELIRVAKLLKFAEKYEVTVYFFSKESFYNPCRICIFKRHYQNPPYQVFVHLPEADIDLEIRGYY